MQRLQFLDTLIASLHYVKRGAVCTGTALSIIAVLFTSSPAAALTAQQRMDYAFKGIEFIDDPCTASSSNAATNDIPAIDITVAGNHINPADAIIQDALKAQAATGVPAAVLLAQGVFESGDAGWWDQTKVDGTKAANYSYFNGGGKHNLNDEFSAYDNNPLGHGPMQLDNWTGAYGGVYSPQRVASFVKGAQSQFGANGTLDAKKIGNIAMMFDTSILYAAVVDADILPAGVKPANATADQWVKVLDDYGTLRGVTQTKKDDWKDLEKQIAGHLGDASAGASTAAGNCCSNNATNNNADLAARTIVIDPGHNAIDYTVKNDDTGLHDHDYPNPPEDSEVFYVSLKVKAQLIKDGYKVVLAKGNDIDTDVTGVNDPKVKQGTQISVGENKSGKGSLETRAALAATEQAALGVSIHDDNIHTWDSFGQVYVQRPELFRTGDKGKKSFSDIVGDAAANKISAASLKAGDAMSKARIAAEGRGAKSLVTDANFDGRPGIDAGNIPQVMLYAKVPWVYNEVGAKGMTKAHLDAYTKGIIKGIEDAVPIVNAGTDQQPATAAGATPADIQMQRVDLTAFKPDPNAVKYFNNTALTKMKKYLPLYIKAAQLEGVAQNWEILPSLHGPELDFQNYYKSNGVSNNPAGGAGGPSGPYQETAYEMRSYLKDAAYGPVLKTLVRPDGTAIPHDHLTDDQFIVLSRLAFHRWVRQALGTDYDKLKKGPVPFSAATDSTNFLARVMGRWNSGNAVEGFNGYNTGANKYNPKAAINPGMATTYYLLKQWEADGGMATVGAIKQDCPN